LIWVCGLGVSIPSNLTHILKERDNLLFSSLSSKPISLNPKTTTNRQLEEEGKKKIRIGFFSRIANEKSIFLFLQSCQFITTHLPNSEVFSFL